MLRKFAVVCAAAAALLAVQAAPAAAGVDDFTGQWSNPDRATDGVTRVVVTRVSGAVRIDVFGQCHPTDCDWGTVNAQPYAPSAGGDISRDATALVAQYNTSFARKLVIVRLTRDGLSYEVFTNFTDRSRRADYIESGRLQRARGHFPPPGFGGPGGGGPGGGPGRPGGPGGGGGYHPAPISEDCVGFNPTNLQVVNIAGRWKIVEGSHWIADFGANRAAANRSLDIIRNYGFSSQCFVARPNPSMTYWRRGNDVPSGAMPGEDCINVNPGNVQARLVSGAWKVVDGSSWLLDYGANRANAEHAVEIIQHYNLNRQCFVARPNPPMQYWLSR